MLAFGKLKIIPEAPLLVKSSVDNEILASLPRTIMDLLFAIR
jgi:hypothetical protein